MISLRRSPDAYKPEYPGDVRALQDTLNRAGYGAGLVDILWAWQRVSDNACAGWLSVDSYSEQERIDRLLGFLVPDEEGCDNCGC